MVDIGKLKPAWFDHRTDIPQWICNRIAYAVVEWAVLERELEELIRILMDGEIQQVRILVNNMNARTRVQTAANLIQALMVLKKLKRRDRTRLNNLGKKIETAQNNRDMLAHGLWSKHEGKWHVLRLRQSRPTPQLRPSIERLSRSVLPQRELITSEKLDSIAREIVSLAKRIEVFCRYLLRVLAPRNTPPQYSRRRRDYRLRRRKKARRGGSQSSRP
jgi:hypothetical protein